MGNQNFFVLDPTQRSGNYKNSLSHFFDKTFVKVTALLKELLKRWFHEIFFSVRKNFSSIRLSISAHIVKITILSRIFCQKCVQIIGKKFVKVLFLLNKLKNWFHGRNFGEREFRVFPHTVQCKNYVFLPSSSFHKNSTKSTHLDLIILIAK